MVQHLFIGNSIYSLFLYTLKHTDKIDETLFVLGTSVHGVDVNHKILLPAGGQKTGRKIKYARALIERLSIQAPLIQTCYMNVQSIGDDIADTLAAHYHSVALSDGLSDFQNFPKYMAANRFDAYYRVTSQGEPDLPDHAGMDTDTIADLWRQKTPVEQQKIAQVFRLTQQDLQTFAQKQVILVTQPLSEDNIMTAQQKECFYRDMMSAYPKNSFVIKPHPREKTDWSKVFPNAPIISRMLPMELLALLVPVQKLATFYSTAGTNLVDPSKVDFYAKDFEKLVFVDPKQEKMGTTPYVNVEEKFGGFGFNLKCIPNGKRWYGDAKHLCCHKTKKTSVWHALRSALRQRF